MAFKIEIKTDIKGLLLKDFNKAMRIFEDEFSKLFEEGTSFLLREVMHGTPVWRGTLVGSEFKEVKGSALNLHGIVATPMSYAGMVETGLPAHTPNLDNLAQWVHAKMGLTGSHLYAVVNVIGRKISQSGINPHFMFRNAFEKGKIEIDKMVQKTEKKIIERWDKE